MPIAQECPYTEGLFDPGNKVLVMMSKDKKEIFHMVPKLDDNGDPIKVKTPRPAGRPPYKEERKIMQTYQEHYITEKDEVQAMIELIATNSDSYDYKQYLNPAIIQVPKASIIMP